VYNADLNQRFLGRYFEKALAAFFEREDASEVPSSPSSGSQSSLH
jgi:hypothetical protein